MTGEMEFTKLAYLDEEIKEWLAENPSNHSSSSMITNFLVLKALDSFTERRFKTYVIHHWNWNRIPSEELKSAWEQADHVICCHPEALPDVVISKHIFRDHKGPVQYKQGRFSPVYID